MSGLSNANEPANPVTPTDRSGQIGDQFLGLTKREYFAAMAMQGMLSRDAYSDQRCAELAVIYADALLVELAK